MPERRVLSFDRLDDAMAEVDRLLEGHATLGRWSLGQICNHLAATIRHSAEGFPGRAPWPLRKTAGPVVKRLLLKRGRMPDGVRSPESLRPRPGLDGRAEAEALRASIRLFASSPGPLADHPFFGPMSVEEWRRLHCIHAAHHLGFVVPEPQPAA